MPNIDQAAKDWQVEWAGRIGAAIQDRRKKLKLTAQQLSQRTEQLGYPISRVAISKIESNSRAGKVEVAEIAVLGMALGIPPVMLLYPGLPHTSIRYLPGFQHYSIDALRWFTGENLGLLDTGLVDWQAINDGAIPLKLARDFHKEEMVVRGSEVRAEQLDAEGETDQAQEYRRNAERHRHARDQFVALMRDLGLPVSNDYPDLERLSRIYDA